MIDPLSAGANYPNTYLAGVGVAYKLVCGLYERLARPLPHALLDLVALGTIADLVPLADEGEVENRAMVREAFALIARGEGSSLGLRVLLEKLNLNPRRLSASDIGFYVAPKLNAANRTGDPKVAFLLLTTARPERAKYLTEILLDYNRDREIAQDDLIAQTEELIAEEGADPRRDGIVVLVGKYWNEGILGLAASHLADRYHVPAVVVSQGDVTSRASCRSAGGLDMAACLKAHAGLLLQHGGHRMAAGFTVSNDLLPELRRRLLLYVQERSGARGASVATVDAQVAPGDVDVRFYTNICSLSPYGPGNPAPRFLLSDCAFSDLSLVGARRQHLKGKAIRNGTALPFIAFRMGGHIGAFEEARGAALVFRAGFDDWQGGVQLEVVDLVDG